MSNEKGMAPLIILSFVIILAVIGMIYYYFGVNRPSSEEDVDITESLMVEEEVVEDRISDVIIDGQENQDWKLYRNDKFRFSFSYPEKWGDVVSTEGNRSHEGLKCLETRRPTVFIHDKIFSFTNVPVGIELRVLKFDPANPILSICRKNNITIDLTQDRLNLTNRNNVQYRYMDLYTNSSGLLVISTPKPASNLGTSMARFYKFYNTDVEVEGLAEFAPYYGSSELEEINTRFYCEENVWDDELCGIEAWFNKSENAGKVRDAFEAFHKVIDSFSFY